MDEWVEEAEGDFLVKHNFLAEKVPPGMGVGGLMKVRGWS